MEYLNNLGEKSKKASLVTAKLTTGQKNDILKRCAEALVENTDIILSSNEKDMADAEANGVKGSLLDRLLLNESRVLSLAEGLVSIAALDDPLGEVLSMKTLPNGLIVGQKRVPMGVIGIICEARPNVTSDAAGLCLKAGSASILRGGKEAINSNKAIVDIFQKTYAKCGFSEHMTMLVEDTSRETAVELMRLNKYVDLLIPRGGQGLIKSVVENSTIPVIETGIGVCHIYVDETADFDMAVKIIINAKTQRPGVCNACEKLLVNAKIAKAFIPLICGELKNYKVEIRGDEAVREIIDGVSLATEDDWYAEYLDYIISIKVVSDVDEAIEHIQKYSSKHSDAILTESYANSQKFLDEVDSAAVYVNASTRFTDGYVFGLGAEIGISTQKLHARGPMGLKEITSTKYIIYGNGQIRL